MTDSKTSIVRTLQGVVVSNKMQDTIVILVERRVKHPKYGKYIKKTTKVHAHDAGNTCKIGDTVIVKESRPLSKMKNWVLVSIKQSAA